MAMEHDEHAEALIQQQELLATHRRVLAHLLRQAAIFSIFTPSFIAHDIEEKRAAICMLKDALRTAGITADDMPGDLPATSPIERHARRLHLLGVLIIVVVLVVTVLELNVGVASLRMRWMSGVYCH